MEADRVVVELIAKVDGFDGKVKQSATQFDNSMNKIAGAAVKGERAVRDTSLGVVKASTQMYRGFDDVSKFLSSPSSPFVVPVKQGPAVVGAMRLVSGAAATMGGIFGGLVVTGALAAAAALADLLFKTKGNREEIEELIKKLKEKAEKTELARQADEQFARTAEGAAIALRQITDALDTQNRSLEENIALQKQKIQQNLAVVQGGIAAQERELAEARAELRSLQENRGLVAGAGGDSGRDIIAAKEKIDELQRSLARLKSAAEGGQRALVAVNFPLLERNAEAAVDPIKKINLQYDAMRDSAEKAAIGNKKLAASLQQTLIQIEKNRAAALKAARDTPKSGMSKVSLGEVKSLVKDVFGSGTAITSTTGGKHAKNSYHYAAQAVDFVPQGGMKAFDKEMLRLAAEARGIKVIELLGPGDKDHANHGHLAFARQRQGPDQIAAARERAAAKIETAADTEERRQQAYLNEIATLGQQIIDARQALLNSAEDVAALETAAINVERQRYDANLQALVETEKLLPKEAEELRKLNEERAKLRIEIVQRREQERKFREQEAANARQLDERTAGLDTQADLLESQQDLARTQKERREIEHRLLDLQFEEERLRLQYIIDYAERLKLSQTATEEEKRAAESAAAIASGQLGTLPGREANARESADRGTAGPLEELFNRLPQTAEEISEAFEAIAANGLDALADSITGVIMGTQSLGQAFSTIAQAIIRDIIAMTVKMLIFRALSSALGLPGMSGGGGVALTGGGVPPIFGGGMPYLPGGATGIYGKVGGRGGTDQNVISINGRPTMRASQGETLAVIPSNARAAGAGGGGVTVLQSFTLDARGGVVTADLLRQVNVIATTRAAQAGQAAFDASQKAMPQRFAQFSKLGS